MVDDNVGLVPPPAGITQTLTDAVVHHGVGAVFVLMAIDALLPVGGELIMVVAGAIASGALAATPTLFGHPLDAGLQTYLVLAVAGTLGYLLGSVAGWLIGRESAWRRWSATDTSCTSARRNLHRAERWFHRHGAAAVFLGRLTPLVRSFISIPAGLFGEPFARYVGLTLLGSAIWCFGFAGLGWALGSSYRSADHATHLLEAGLIVLAVAVAAWLLLRRRRPSA